MRHGTHNESQALERLSALADGEVEQASVADLCAVWRDEPAACASWHAWHLIGDVLRSEDLSSDARHDAAFLRTLRQRMAGEAVVLAPTALPRSDAPFSSPVSSGSPAAGGRQSWISWRRLGAPAAVAAGFIAVAGVLLAIQAPAPLPASSTLATAPDASVRAVVNAPPAALAAAEPSTANASGRLIRDARLDRYLAAHKQFGGSTALGVPSGFLRSATAEVPNR